MASEKRTRGPNKRAPWVRKVEDGLSVLRLALDTHDPAQRALVEAMFDGAYKVKRALQRDARDRSSAYWSAVHERGRDAEATKARLGLSQKGFEGAARAHVAAAPHLRRFVTKALAQHLADSVWTGVERHLCRDASGKRHGAPHIGRWFDFTRIPGRARSHTERNKWETFRLHGTLAGHRAAYTDVTGDFVQPSRMRPVDSEAWWYYTGPLAVVFTSIDGGPLVLPVRLPTAPSNQAILDHHLADPSRWHKVDLVRTRAPHAPGGWRYEAHLMVLIQPYVSPGAQARRANAAIATAGRTAGIDLNVSNVTVASHEGGIDVRVTRIERDATQRERDRGRARRERTRQRSVERSRRAMNKAQYKLSKRQEKRARRRTEAHLPPVDVIPMGPRRARSDGKPLQSFRQDILSASYRHLRAAQAADAARATQARSNRARAVAADLVATHGYQLVVEDTNVASWARSWGRSVAAFSPGMLRAAIERESKAVASIAGCMGGVSRAATRTTALSQHCPCGAAAPKALRDRIHRCTACNLVADRDAVAAALASFVVLDQPGVPTSARVDYAASAAALPAIRRALSISYTGWQGTLTESTDLSAREGSFLTWRTSTPDSVEAARRIVGTAPDPTLNETGSRQTTSDRIGMRTNMFKKHDLPWSYFRDIP